MELIEKNDRMIVAVSGGVDSMVMLDCLYNLKDKLNLYLVVVHINHHKRPAAPKEMAFVKDTAQKHGLEYVGYDYHHDGTGNFHQSSRKARLELLLKAAQQYSATKIALAHQADDLVETIMMRLTRGSSFSGYGGINERLLVGSVTVIRPLLDVSRDEILKYQSEHHIAYMEDDSNQTDAYTRNRFRHHVIPYLRQENPQYTAKFSQFSNYIQEASDHIQKCGSTFISNHLTIADQVARLPINLLLGEDRIIQKEILIQAIGRLTDNQVEISYLQLEELCDMLSSGKSRHEIDLEGGLVAKKSYNQALLYRELPDYGQYEYVLTGKDEIILPTGYRVSLSENTANFNGKCTELWYNDLDFILPLTVRNRRAGDRITMPYGTKKLKTFFIEKKVPHLLRDELPLVFDRNMNLLWIPGYYHNKPGVGETNKLNLCYWKGNSNA